MTRRGALPRGAGAVRCVDCGAEARADGKGSPIVLKHQPLCRNALDIKSEIDWGDERDEPRLGLATTRQLLDELRARAEVSMVSCPRVEIMMYGRLYRAARVMLETMTEDALNYRTVGEPDQPV